MSWQGFLLTRALRRWIKADPLRDQPIEAMRAQAARVPFGAKLPAGWHVRPTQAAPLVGEWIEPAASACSRCILYLHGGGYTAMSPRTHRAITSRLASWSGARLFALEYRLAPEHPFPAALDDALAAYRALAADMPAARITLAGDSAGGGLALAVLVALRDAGDALPAAAALFSPWTDLAVTGDSIVGNEACDALFYGAWVARLTRHYLAGTDPTHPLASPLYADLRGLPPLLVQVSDTEVLLDDSRRLVERARQAGVTATLQTWHDLPHGWQMFAPILPEARAALRDAAGFLRAAVRP